MSGGCHSLALSISFTSICLPVACFNTLLLFRAEFRWRDRDERKMLPIVDKLSNDPSSKGLPAILLVKPDQEAVVFDDSRQVSVKRRIDTPHDLVGADLGSLE